MSEIRFECARRWAGGAMVDLKPTLIGDRPVYAPDRVADVLHLRLDLAVDMRAKKLEGTATTLVRFFRGGLREIDFNAVDMRIAGVWDESGAKLSHRHDKKMIHIRMRRPSRAGETASFKIQYQVLNPELGAHFVEGGQMWTQGQPEDARYWFPCHDSPQVKATSEVIAAVPDGYTAVSNGVLIDMRRDKARGTSIFHWKMGHPHSMYLISLVVGKFSVVKERWRGVDVSYYCPEGRQEDARRGFGKTPKMLEYFSEKIGVTYPYEKYAQVTAFHFPGGMENTTCTTQTDAALLDRRAGLDTDLDGLVAHELAHQWFGDLLTCKDWSHAWLNEGFATYFEVLFTAFDKGRDEALYELRQYSKTYFDEDQNRYRRPIVCNRFMAPWVLFDRHLYEKAGAVLHMLRGELGEELWWRCLKEYVGRHRNRSVETADLIEVLRDVTGRNFKPFFDQWIFGSGHPAFRIHYEWSPASRKAKLWVLQTQSSEPSVFRLPATLLFCGRNWEKPFQVQIDAKEHRFEFKLAAEPSNVEFDPDHWILKRTDFKKPLSFWIHQLTHGGNAVSRIEAAEALGRWPAASSAAALADAFGREKFWAVRKEIALILGRQRLPQSLPRLRGWLRTPHPKVRRAVVEALGQYRAPDAAKWLRPLFRRDPSYHVESAAAQAMAKGVSPALFPELVKNLRKDSWWDVVRAGTISALTLTRDPRAIAVLKRHCAKRHHLSARMAAVKGLKEFHAADPGIVPYLTSLLKEKDVQSFTLGVVSTLGQIEDARALPVLKRLKKDSKDDRIRIYCEEAILRIQGCSLAQTAAG
ncbi:MAG: HEAT repeat domain-containing protein [Elusimicrobia bacterium]|nr:HEAT repeat domain-containing protein [Elusimicrobiota bacterium]